MKSEKQLPRAEEEADGSAVGDILEEHDESSDAEEAGGSKESERGAEGEGECGDESGSESSGSEEDEEKNIFKIEVVKGKRKKRMEAEDKVLAARYQRATEPPPSPTHTIPTHQFPRTRSTLQKK